MENMKNITEVVLKVDKRLSKVWQNAHKFIRQLAHYITFE